MKLLIIPTIALLFRAHNAHGECRGGCRGDTRWYCSPSDQVVAEGIGTIGDDCPSSIPTLACCMDVLCTSNVDGCRLIEVSLNGCDKKTISWMAVCQDGDAFTDPTDTGDGVCFDEQGNDITTTEGVYDGEKQKCNSVSTIKFKVCDKSVSTVTLHAHDGKFYGNLPDTTDVQTETCGGIGGGCFGKDGNSAACGLELEIGSGGSGGTCGTYIPPAECGGPNPGPDNCSSLSTLSCNTCDYICAAADSCACGARRLGSNKFFY